MQKRKLRSRLQVHSAMPQCCPCMTRPAWVAASAVAHQQSSCLGEILTTKQVCYKSRLIRPQSISKAVAWLRYCNKAKHQQSSCLVEILQQSKASAKQSLGRNTTTKQACYKSWVVRNKALQQVLVHVLASTLQSGALASVCTVFPPLQCLEPKGSLNRS